MQIDPCLGIKYALRAGASKVRHGRHRSSRFCAGNDLQGGRGSQALPRIRCLRQRVLEPEALMLIGQSACAG